MSEKNYRYVDPLSPFGFRHLFGNESRKEILLEFLNVLFEGENRILNAVSPPEKDTADYPGAEDALLNLVCTDEDGDGFTVQIRNLGEHNFREKNRQFMARHFSNSVSKDQSTSAFPYKDNFLVGFLSSRLSERTKFLHFKDVFHLQKDQEESYSGILGFKFMEISGQDDPGEELENELEKWLYVFRNMRQLGHQPDVLDSPVFGKLFKLAEIANLTAEQRLEYEKSLKTEQENADENRKEAKDPGKRRADFERMLSSISHGIIIKVTQITDEEAERYKSRK